MRTEIIVFLGAGLGGALRHNLNQAVTRLTGPSFPMGILAVNVIGCFAMGVIAGGSRFAALPEPTGDYF